MIVKPLLNNFINYKKNINSYPVMIYNPTKPDLILFSSIILETFSTFCLKKTLYNKLWFIPVYSGYALSFYLFPKVLTKFTLSNAYTIWCGLGIIITTILDILIYKEIYTFKKIIGTLIIIYGVYYIN